VRAAIEATPASFRGIAAQAAWAEVEFISDQPGKNGKTFALDGGGATAAKLAALVDGARERTLIQSPYLVLSDRVLELFGKARACGVRIAISPNSMAAAGKATVLSLQAKSMVVDSKIADIGTFNLDPRSENLNT
jgi:putative cardiolipin synthase